MARTFVVELVGAHIEAGPVGVLERACLALLPLLFCPRLHHGLPVLLKFRLTGLEVALKMVPLRRLEAPHVFLAGRYSRAPAGDMVLYSSRECRGDCVINGADRPDLLRLRAASRRHSRGAHGKQGGEHRYLPAASSSARCPAASLRVARWQATVPLRVPVLLMTRSRTSTTVVCRESSLESVRLINRLGSLLQYDCTQVLRVKAQLQSLAHASALRVECNPCAFATGVRALPQA